MAGKRRRPRTTLGALIRKSKVLLSKASPRRRNPQSLSPAERKELAIAERLSREFHGRAHVVELNPAERRALPRFVAVAGDLQAFTYAPKAGKRAGANWEHESGDRGPLARRGREKPLLVIDPRTRRPAIVANRSGMRFSPKRGFIG